jgi:hypothetical protein
MTQLYLCIYYVIMLFYISLPSRPSINMLHAMVDSERCSVFRVDRVVETSGYLCYEVSYAKTWILWTTHNMKAGFLSEASILIYERAWRFNPGDLKLYHYCCQKLRSRISFRENFVCCFPWTMTKIRVLLSQRQFNVHDLCSVCS